MRRQALSNAEYVEKLKARCVVTNTGCWEWAGYCHPPRKGSLHVRGYASIYHHGKSYAGGRLMLMLSVRPLEKWEHACHTCDNPPCINPDHLWIGTNRQNQLDSVAKGRNAYQLRTHCPLGHEYTAETTYWKRGKDGREARQCKLCSRVQQRLRAGWTFEQAMHMPPTPHGHRPVNGTFHKPGGQS